MKKQGSIISHCVKTDYHLLNLTEFSCPEDKPYLGIFFGDTVLELISDYRRVQENSDFKISPSKKTVVFDIRTPNNIKKLYFCFF